jgi:hypothetical protein
MLGVIEISTRWAESIELSLLMELVREIWDGCISSAMLETARLSSITEGILIVDIAVSFRVDIRLPKIERLKQISPDITSHPYDKRKKIKNRH